VQSTFKPVINDEYCVDHFDEEFTQECKTYFCPTYNLLVAQNTFVPNIPKNVQRINDEFADFTY